MELVPFFLFCHFSGLHRGAVGLSMAWAPAIAPLTEVVGAVLAEVSRFLALRAMTANRGGRRVGGRGATFWVWLISGAFAPCPIAMDVHVKLLEIVDDASSCEASVDEVRDKEFVGVPDDI